MLKNVLVNKEWPTYFLIFILGLIVFLNSPNTRISDSKYTLLLSEQIIDHGNFKLDAYFWSDCSLEKDCLSQDLPHHESIRHMAESNDHVYYEYPYGTSVLSVPFVLAYRVFGISTIDSKGRTKQ